MKVVRHSHHEQFLRLANEDAALLVSSGRWVYTSKFEARKAALQPRRTLLARIGMFAAAAVAGLLLLSTSAKAADKPVPKLVPYKVCLSQAQARQVYPGQHLKYREVQGERCWFAGKTLPKSAFIIKDHPRAVGTAVIPARQSNTEQQRVQVAPDVSITSAGNSPIVTEFTAMLATDAFLALTGRSERDFERATFDAMWAGAMRDAAGVR